MHATEGRTIGGKYELIRKVGRGAMGVVFEARHSGTLKRCAVKLLPSEFEDNPKRVRRLLREARASGIVDSDHIVKTYDSGIDPQTGCPYLVMEYLEGEDLQKALGRLGAIEPQAALKITLQAALGLARAHAAGIVHRDIKPANLFLTRGDSGEIVVKILDFGIAKIKIDKPVDASRSESLLGTPLYMSPEQLGGSTVLGPESDVWSLGIVLWELLTGAPPFRAQGLASLISLITSAELPRLEQHAACPAGAARVVSRALARDGSRRYPNARALAEALRGVVDGPYLHPDALVSAAKGPGGHAGDFGCSPTIDVAAGRLPRPLFRAWAPVLTLAAGLGAAVALWIGMRPEPARSAPPPTIARAIGERRDPPAPPLEPSASALAASPASALERSAPSQSPQPPPALRRALVRNDAPRTPIHAAPRAAASSSEPRASAPVTRKDPISGLVVGYEEFGGALDELAKD